MAQDPKHTAHPGTDKDGKDGKAPQDGENPTTGQGAAQQPAKAADKGSAGHQSDSPTGSHPHGEKKTTP